jgi:hypothetical protein
VNEPVMENKIDYSINCYPNTNPKFNIQIYSSHPHQINRNYGKKHAENIVKLKPPRSLLVMAFVYEPQRAMK